MRPKIELGKEYSTRGGGKAVVYRNDGEGNYPLIGAMHNSTGWGSMHWRKDGTVMDNNEAHSFDILLPRTVMVPIAVPRWAKSVMVSEYGQPAFSCDPADSVWLSIEDWIASLEENDAS